MEILFEHPNDEYPIRLVYDKTAVVFPYTLQQFRYDPKERYEHPSATIDLTGEAVLGLKAALNND